MQPNQSSAPGDRFESALSKFDQENARDPRMDNVDGAPVPRELLHARRVSAWIERLCPKPSEALRLAARAQHLCRWKIPRDQYPMTRPGYHRWRTELKKMHADLAGDILRESGYDPQTVGLVQQLITKANFPADPDSRILEDAVCLTFLQHELADFAHRTDRDKVINALRKSWAKMSPAGQAQALSLDYPPEIKSLIHEALQPT